MTPEERRATARKLAAYLRALAFDIDTGRYEASGVINQVSVPDGDEGPQEFVTALVTGLRKRTSP